MPKSKRSKIELYADVLKALKAHEGGCKITKLSYGSNMPLDRLKKLTEELISMGLITKRVEDPAVYVITSRGAEFLVAFNRLQIFFQHEVKRKTQTESASSIA
ncbi:MAG: winged helix-turn-helix domain-containing protein [Candidatus Bathyarchaeia archaeon]